MKIIKVVSSLLFVAVVPNAFSDTGTAINKNDLIGSWNCTHQFVEPSTKMLINVDYKTNFIANGNAYGSGDLLFTIEGMPKINYKASDNSTWSLKGDELTIKSKNINFTNVSHPQLDKFLDIKKILPASINESGKLTTLTSNKLTVKSNSYGKSYSCTKVASAK